MLLPSEQFEVLQAMLANTFHLQAIRGGQEGKVYLLLLKRRRNDQSV